MQARANVCLTFFGLVSVALQGAPADARMDSTAPLALIGPVLQDWKFSDSSLAGMANEGRNGGPCLKLKADPKATEGASSTWANRRLDITSFDPNGEYRLQFSVRTDVMLREFYLTMGLVKGDERPVVIKGEWVQVVADWQTVTRDFFGVDTGAIEAVLQFAVKAPGTVWIDNLKIQKLPKGMIASEGSHLKDLPAFVGSPDYVQITPDRRIILRGKPFFPIGILGADFLSPEMMKDARSLGFNTIGSGHLISRKVEGTKAYLDLAKSNDLMVLGVTRLAGTLNGITVAPTGVTTEQALTFVEEKKKEFLPILEVMRKHPALLAYDFADENILAGDNLEAVAEVAHWIRATDPNHPVWGNQAPRQSVALFKSYYRFMDIGGSDIYPWWNGEPDQHSDLPNKTLSVVGDECQKNIEAIGPGKPVFMYLQAFGWSDEMGPIRYKGYGYPPLHVLRFMGYDAIVNGASGVIFFQDHDYPGIIVNMIKPIALELAAIHDVLAAPTQEGTTKSLDKRLAIILKKHGEDSYIIAVNRTAQEFEAGIEVPGSESVWQVLFKGGSVTAEKKVITDRFAPWDVRIYTDGKETESLRATWR